MQTIYNILIHNVFDNSVRHLINLCEFKKLSPFKETKILALNYILKISLKILFPEEQTVKKHTSRRRSYNNRANPRVNAPKATCSPKSLGALKSSFERVQWKK